MRLLFITFTRRGFNTANKIADCLESDFGYTTLRRVKCDSLGKISERGKASDKMEQWLTDVDGVVFVCACGIAVRLMAPFVENKTIDPAVVVVDERGSFSISLLSGHIGGANDLAKKVAKAIGAVAVITTATDINNLFSPDSFAKRNNMHISDMTGAKIISADIVEGTKVGLFSDFNIDGQTPNEFLLNGKDCEHSLVISYHNVKNTLVLTPKVITVGIGCRKNTNLEKIEMAVMSCLEENNINIHALEAVSSIDLKSNEKGILDFCNKYNLDFYTYDAEMLKAVDGIFSESEFVNKITGVGNVCERSAVCHSKGHLIQYKKVFDGVTVAIAIRELSISFEN